MSTWKKPPTLDCLFSISLTLYFCLCIFYICPSDLFPLKYLFICFSIFASNFLSVLSLSLTFFFFLFLQHILKVKCILIFTDKHLISWVVSIILSIFDGVLNFPQIILSFISVWWFVSNVQCKCGKLKNQKSIMKMHF